MVFLPRAPDSLGQAREAFDREAMSLARGPAKILTGDIFAQTAFAIAPAEFGESGRTRPILKIQDGCNNRCSYCVIPFVRGRSRSLPPDVVIAEVRALVGSPARSTDFGARVSVKLRPLSP